MSGMEAQTPSRFNVMGVIAMSTTDFDFLLRDWAVHHRRLRHRLAGDNTREEVSGLEGAL
jgi:hypothetical protein